LQRNRAMPDHRGKFSNASRTGNSSSYTYQLRPTCGRRRCCCGWAGIAATTAVVSQTTTHESAGCGMRVVPRHSDRSTGGLPTQHGFGVLLLQISRCRPSKQYRPDSTVLFGCECVGDTTNALTFSTTCCSHGRLL